MIQEVTAEDERKVTLSDGFDYTVHCDDDFVTKCSTGSCEPPIYFTDFDGEDLKTIMGACPIKMNENNNMKRRINEETINRKTEQQIKLGLTKDNSDLVINFFKHMESHGATWDALSLQAAMQNVTRSGTDNKSAYRLFQWILWNLKDKDSSASTNLENSLKSAKDFHELNQALLDASEVANDWWPNSPGGKHEEGGHEDHSADSEKSYAEEQNEQIRATIQKIIKEIREERVGSSPSEPKHLSEARAHVRSAINEMMVGLTPITRIDTQEYANNARKGNNTNSAVNKADIGFNTYDMHEWASIAGITELQEHWEDDGYGNNVIPLDVDEPESDEPREIEGMVTCDDPSDMSGPVTGDIGRASEVGNMELDFEDFLQGLETQDDAGVQRIGAAAVEGDEHYEDEYAEHGDDGRGRRG